MGQEKNTPYLDLYKKYEKYPSGEVRDGLVHLAEK
jgi:hypothetical protein